MPDEYVLTSLGPRPASAVRIAERGAIVETTILEPSLAEAAGSATRRAGMLSGADSATPGFVNGWITDAEWDNATGSPVASFSTTWVVPPGPTSESGQVVFLWNGMENNAWVLQPVLQWGNRGGTDGGGRYWSVASWYVSADVNADPVRSKLTRVNPGDVLTGLITLTGQADGKFSYRCEFVGIPDSVLNVVTTPQLNRCFEVLETWSALLCTDYPAVCSSGMADIDIQVTGDSGPVHPTVTWNPGTIVDNCGEHTTVASNSASEGRVDIHYRRATPLPTLAHVATSLRAGLVQTDVYLASTSGAVAMMWAGEAGGWQGPVPLTAAGTMPGGGTVVGTARAGIAGRTDVYFVDSTGAVCAMWVPGNSYWNGPDKLTRASLVPPGAAVAARPRLGIPGQTDVYFTDNAGAISAIWAVGSGPWNGPAQLSSAGVAPAGAPIAVSPHYGVDDRTDLFFVDIEGALNVMWAVGLSQWRQPARLTTTGVAPPGTVVTASPQYGIDGQTDVFFVDQTGSVVAFWVVGDGPWNGPAVLTVPRVAPPGATLAAAQHQGIDNQTDLFFIDQTGSVVALWVVGSGSWNGPAVLTAPVANPGARLAVGPRYGQAGVTNVAFVDRKGQMNVLSASGTQPWTAPVVVGC